MFFFLFGQVGQIREERLNKELAITLHIHVCVMHATTALGIPRFVCRDGNSCPCLNESLQTLDVLFSV